MIWKALLTLIISLPKLLELVDRLEKSLGPNWDLVITHNAEAYAAFKKASTPEEKDAALKSVATAWTQL